MLVLIIIGYILLVLMFIIFAILFIPLFFHLHAVKNDSFYLSASINAFFKILFFYIEKKEGEKPTISAQIFGIRIPVKINEVNKEGQVKTQKKRGNNYRFLLDRILLKRIFQSIKKILKHISPREIKVYAEYGFKDPADTGILCGMIGLFSNYFSKYNIGLMPIFDRETLKGEIFLKGRILIFVIAFYILQVVLSKAFRDAMKKNKKN